MKNLNFIGLILACLCFFVSCQPDDDFDIRDEWVGTYEAVETCGDEAPIYSDLFIEKGNRRDEVELSGLIYGINFELTGIIDNARLTIPRQSYFVRFSPDIFYEFNGTGILVDKILDLNYSVGYCQEEPFGLNCVNQGSCAINLVRF